MGYRGFSNDALKDCASQYGNRMTLLNALGLTNSKMEEYHYEFLKKKPENNKIISWLDFAALHVDNYPEHITSVQRSKSNYDFHESKTDDTVVVNVTLRFSNYDYKETK